MKEPNNQALRAEALAFIRSMALNSAQTVSAMRRVEEALTTLTTDRHAQGRLAGLEEAKALVPYTSHAIGCAIYQRSWVSGEPPCTCGLDDARDAICAIAKAGQSSPVASNLEGQNP